MDSQSIAVELAKRFKDYRDKIDRIGTQLRQYKIMIDLCPLPVMFCDERGYALYVNAAYLKMVNAPLSDAQHDFWLDLIHAEDRLRVLQHWQQFVGAPECNACEIEYRYVRRDMHILSVLMKAQQISPENIVAYVIPTKFTTLSDWLRGSDPQIHRT